jgi:hypothetical protein
VTAVSFTAHVDVESALQSAIESVSLTGLGADGTSEYEVADVAVVALGDNDYEITVVCDRVEGKFVGKDELAEMIMGEVESLDDIEVSVSL